MAALYETNARSFFATIENKKNLQTLYGFQTFAENPDNLKKRLS